MSSPDFSEFISDCWNGAYNNLTPLWWYASAANLVFGSNPPYTVSDFLQIYPQFGGVSVAITGDVSATSTTVLNVSALTGLAKGQLIYGPDLADPTTIASVTAPSTITLSAMPTASVTGEALTVYTSPFVPLPLLQLYVNLASASLQYGRYFESWPLAMALFIAHYSSLYLRSNGNPTTTAGAAAASGALLGFQTSKSVGDVSVSQQMIVGVGSTQDFGALNLTLFGQELINLMRVAVGVSAIWVG